VIPSIARASIAAPRAFQSRTFVRMPRHLNPSSRPSMSESRALLSLRCEGVAGMPWIAGNGVDVRFRSQVDVRRTSARVRIGENHMVQFHFGQ
jgi:hypothetical protein